MNRFDKLLPLKKSSSTTKESYKKRNKDMMIYNGKNIYYDYLLDHEKPIRQKPNKKD